jgi:hypothetical protein
MKKYSMIASKTSLFSEITVWQPRPCERTACIVLRWVTSNYTTDDRLKCQLFRSFAIGCPIGV